MLKVRRKKLEHFFDKYNLDALLLSNLLNIRYLCGFSGSEGALLLTRNAAWLLCDSRYTTQAAAETTDTEIRQFSERQDAIGTLIQEQKLHRIGFESAHITVSIFMELSSKLQGCELVSIGKDFDQIRSCKDVDEIGKLETVARLASEALQATLVYLKPNVSEVSFARELEFEMRRRGAEGRSFDFIVASGVRGAMPHGRASEKLIGSGELVTIDFGASLNGYHSDETVTVAVGKPDSRSKEIHDIVKEAHDRAIAAVRPGLSGCELDAIARDYITEKGYGEYFGHGLGHGVGLEIHEQPVISPRSRTIIEEGMVFTVEPGIYIPELGGVRIEDTLVVTSHGCRLLTSAPKDMFII
ncbi:aminopeptidase P family protein [Pelotalea chapellei]|uniref:Aminopeptidase P family protein n=1 Tax=Pelotalea chapellei TaxID=44671 RepID=A0ABS5U7R0_9BACT|nr:aminopeptidase P family protein [Pelotalea chapellei]MBT1071700.1 aminopeptidase P family protein [Pelotalea chapellei]